MKNTEIIKVAALLLLTAALLYRKYRKKKPAAGKGQKLPAGSIFASHDADDEYEPYSKKKSEE
jgi:hypothetical protein